MKASVLVVSIKLLRLNYSPQPNSRLRVLLIRRDGRGDQFPKCLSIEAAKKSRKTRREAFFQGRVMICWTPILAICSRLLSNQPIIIQLNIDNIKNK